MPVACLSPLLPPLSLCVCVCVLCLSVYSIYRWMCLLKLERVSDSVELKLELVVSHPMWVLATELQVSTKAEHALNLWAIFLALALIFLSVFPCSFTHFALHLRLLKSLLYSQLPLSSKRLPQWGMLGGEVKILLAPGLDFITRA